ncbi:EspA/EspE family type VII secretion system effector [Mycolicibacterium sp. XJ870]
MGLMSDVAGFGKDVVDDREKWAERLAKVGDFIERNAKGSKLERVATVGRKLADFSTKFTDFFQSGLGTRMAKAARSPILLAGQRVIDGMTLTTGIGDPESGERFGHGADRLSAAGQTLNTAFPDDGWDSSGSDAYIARNNEQLSRTQTMIGADHVVASVLTREAEQVATTRDNLAGQSDWLGDMSLITMATGCIPYVGRAAQIAAEIAMVSKAVGESTNQLMAMQDNANANAAEVRGAVSQYASVADAAEPFDTIDDAADPSGADDDETPAQPGEPDESGEPGEPTMSGEPGAAPPAPGASTGGGAPSGGTASVPAQPIPTPSMPTGVPAAPAGSAGGDAAGVMGAVLGSVLGPLGGMLGGVVQAAGQVAQVATQAATQAAQVASQAAGQSQDPTALAAEADDVDKRAEDDAEGKDEKADRAAEEKDGPGTADETAGEADTAGPDPEAAGENDETAAKTLPPDLEAASADGNAAGLAPVHIGVDSDQGQLRTPVAATLDRGIPRTAVAIDT